jgi:hypothetical protein
MMIMKATVRRMLTGLTMAVGATAMLATGMMIGNATADRPVEVVYVEREWSPTDPHPQFCPTEDSCDIDYRDGYWYVTPTVP